MLCKSVSQRTLSSRVMKRKGTMKNTRCCLKYSSVSVWHGHYCRSPYVKLHSIGNDTPYFDHAIGIAHRSIESKDSLKSTKMMVAIHYDTWPHMSSMQRKAIVCSTVDRPARKPLWTHNNCGSTMSRMRARSLFVSLVKAQLFAIPRWFSRDYELPFFGMETKIMLCFHLSSTELRLSLRIE